MITSAGSGATCPGSAARSSTARCWSRRPWSTCNYGAPIVAVDPHTGQSELPTVDSDNLRGAQLATEHLLGLGPPPDRHAHRTPRPGIGPAPRAGLPAGHGGGRGHGRARTWCWSAGTTRRSRRKPPATLLTAPTGRPRSSPPTTCRPSRPSQVAGEPGPAGARPTCRWWASTTSRSRRCATPPLTTVNQPIRRDGSSAIELLLRLIRGEQVEVTHVTLPTDLVVRQSTRPRYTT